MRIGLDMSLVNLLDGGARYTQQVCVNLCRCFPNDRFLAFGPKPRVKFDFPNLEWIESPPVSGLFARIRYCLCINHKIKKHNLNVFHNLGNYGFLGKACPVVTTIHDLVTLRARFVRSRKLDYWLYRFLLPVLVRAADKVVVSSESTMRDVQELFGLNDNLKRIYLGFDHTFFTAKKGEADQRTLVRFGLNPGFLLFVGYLTTKKNLLVVAEAIQLVRQNYPDIKLVIVGARGPGADEFYSALKSLGVQQNVQELGVVSDLELAALYRNASILVFPSFYEGFGLPVVEAMGCGLPALVSASSSLIELVNRPELMCTTGTSLEWAKKISDILSSDSLLLELKSWALQRAVQFTWEACVSELMQVYREVSRA